MKKLILFSNLFFLLASCSPKSQSTISEMELLNDIFIELVDEYYYEKLPIPPMPLEYAENKQDSLNYQIEKEKFDEAVDNPKLEKADMVLGIEPYHINPKREFRTWYSNDSSFPRMHYKDSLHSEDFDNLLIQLIDSTKFNKGKLELDKLNEKGRYIIKDLGKLEKENKEYWNSSEYRYVASIRFSDFKVNQTNDKAIFYFDFFCGSLCGSGEIIFCIKEGGKWKIADRNALWVS
ncbi:hypothetical protein [Cellulophaga baltica]|uniref:Lipoprotein n=1 Tax=Cellulophaga baltica 18 TaxID=1348584 RepID=A0AAU8RHP6_9FLAO|nr:hypothetical protein [Cellulophaga baltica]AIZ42457.1 hypothetical protein M666_13250 [Cellulophaga baltica 18]WFO16873.1 hypothetical protein M601_003595 [Cellulophaga baltica 4]